MRARLYGAASGLVLAMGLAAAGQGSATAWYCDAPVFGVWDAAWMADAYPSGFVVEAGYCPARSAVDPRCVPAWQFMPYALYDGNRAYCDANLPYALEHEGGRTYLAYRFLIRERRLLEQTDRVWQIPDIGWLGSFRYRGRLGSAMPPAVWADTAGSNGAVPWLMACKGSAAACAAIDPLEQGDRVF